MASRRVGPAGFALGVLARAVLIAALACAAFLAGARGLYATALLAAGLAVLAAVDLARAAAAADRRLAQFVDVLASEGYERPAAPPGLRRLAAAMEAALGRLAATRAARQARIDHLEALIDTVPAALVVSDEAGAIVSANRAARLVLGAARGPLAACPGLDAETAGRLLALRPGAREIVRAGEHRAAMLASVALFRVPGRPAERLIALQSVSGDLGAVELKAWQDLVRVLAHELMNSLTPICSLSESMAGRLRGAEPELADAAAVIARRSAGLMDFVERYRNLVDVPAPAPMRLKAVALTKDLDPLARAMIGRAKIAYESSVHPAGLTLEADPALLEQALINLLKNAVEAVRGRRGGAVRLSCGVEEDAAVFRVEDNGPGVAAREPGAIFVPFFTTKPGGSGVGLTLARQIALAHGGRLDHEPLRPHGSRFTLRLPLG